MSAGTVRVAAIDCGTNSLRLLIADVDRAAGTLRDVERRLEVVRLGRRVDASGRLDPAALDRAFAVTERYAESCRRAGVTRIRFVATSATRDAENRADLVAGVRARIGVVPEVIDGREEAELSFLGATTGLSGRSPYLVVDIGGGSTEFVLGEGAVSSALSVDIGSVRLTERHLGGGDPTLGDPTVNDPTVNDPTVNDPTVNEASLDGRTRGGPAAARALAAAAADVRAGIEAAAAVVDLHRAGTLIGVAGTVTTVTAHALRLPRYDSSAVHGARLPVRQVDAACAELIGSGRAERAALPYVHPGRVDVIVAGALIWRMVVARVAAAAGLETVLTSEHDILDGIARRLAEEG